MTRGRWLLRQNHDRRQRSSGVVTLRDFSSVPGNGVIAAWNIAVISEGGQLQHAGQLPNVDTSLLIWVAQPSTVSMATRPSAMKR